MSRKLSLILQDLLGAEWNSVKVGAGSRVFFLFQLNHLRNDLNSTHFCFNSLIFAFWNRWIWMDFDRLIDIIYCDLDVQRRDERATCFRRDRNQHRFHSKWLGACVNDFSSSLSSANWRLSFWPRLEKVLHCETHANHRESGQDMLQQPNAFVSLSPTAPLYNNCDFSSISKWLIKILSQKRLPIIFFSFDRKMPKTVVLLFFFSSKSLNKFENNFWPSFSFSVSITK